MQLHRFDEEGSSSSVLGGAITDLIETVGLKRFPRQFHGAVRQAAGCDHLAAFAWSDEGPRLLFAETVIDGEGLTARKLAMCYLSFYLPTDPIWDAVAGLQDGNGLCVVELDADDVRLADRHAACVLKGHSRISLTQIRDGRRLLLNFLRAGSFSPEHRESILQSAGLLMPLVSRHELASRANPDDYRAELRLRFEQRAPFLSARELDVCVLIVAGLSSEGIALELGVSVNTVLTYRKRAYARLGISSQNELMRAILT